jgi:K+:H+ antiporter
MGILMLLLLTGMETDLSVFRRSRGTAAAVSVAGIAVPFACGIGLGLLLPDALLPDPGKRLITTLFLATALSISSTPELPRPRAQGQPSRCKWPMGGRSAG